MKTIYNHIRKVDPDAVKRLSLRTYDLVPRYNIYVVDDKLMTMQAYAYGRGEDTPTFVLRRHTSDGLFEFYASVVRHVLEQSNPVDIEESIQR